MADDDRRPAQSHDVQSFAPTFNCPPSQEVMPEPDPLPSSPPRPRKKAQRRRKRYAPPGPAGVWFQSQRHSTATADSTAHDKRSRNNTKEANHVEAAPDVSSCPTWMCMQHSLGICTPYLPPYLSTSQRYTYLRPLLATHYLLLPELLQQQQQGASLHSVRGKKLLVLVHAAAIQYHSYWTVELRDECGASLKAWMDPEMKEKECAALLQMGVVWLLQDLCLLVADTPSRHSWLLISRDQIERAWTPQQAAKEFTDEQYIEWMSKRSQMTNRVLVDDDNPQDNGQKLQMEEEDYEHKDDEHESHEQSRKVDSEEEDDSILPRDFASRSVTPHPSSSANRNQRPPAVAISSEADNVDTPLVRQAAESLQARVGRNSGHDNGASGVVDSRHDERNQQEAASINPVSPFQRSTSTSVTSVSPKQNSSPPAVSNPYAIKPRPQQGTTSTTGSDWFAVSSEARANQTLSASLHTTRASVVTVAQDRSQPRHMNGNAKANDGNVLSPTRAASGTGNNNISFSQFLSPMSSAPSNLTHSDTALALNPYPKKKKEASDVPLHRDASLSVKVAATTSQQTFPSRNKNASTQESSQESALSKKASTASTGVSEPSGFFLQFAAVSTVTGNVSLSQKENVSSQSPKIPKRRRSPKKGSEKAKTPPKASTRSQTKKRTPKTEASPKEPSMLWLGADTSMMEMLDEDGDGQEASPPQSPPATMLLNDAKEIDVPVEPSQQEESSTPDQEASAVFQASSFAGINMDDLFDEED